MKHSLTVKSDRPAFRWKRSLSLALGHRDRRALYIGFMSVSILIVLSRGVPFWLSWTRAVREDARATTRELSSADALMHAQRMLTDSLSARGDRLVSVVPAFLSGTSPEAAGAALAGVISQAATDSRVEMGSMEIRADSLGSGEVARVSVRAVASGDVSGVMEMLATIEAAPQLLAVHSLEIDQPEPDATLATMERLQITLVVEGLLLTPRMEKGS
jgi:hypothetical protein